MKRWPTFTGTAERQNGRPCLVTTLSARVRASFVRCLLVVCCVAPSLTWAATSAPRSDGSVWNIDFEGFIDGGVGYLNAGVRRLGDGSPEGNEAHAMVIVSRDLAFAGTRCAHIVAETRDRRAAIDLLRRFGAPEVDDEVIEFVYRPTADKPIDLREFSVWRAAGYGGGAAGIMLYANGSASSGEYRLDIQTDTHAESRVKNVVSGLKQTEWIRVIMARDNASKKVTLWVGPPGSERLVGRFADADPNRRIGKAAIGISGSSDSCGAGYWDDFRVGKPLPPGATPAPAETVREVGSELPEIKYPIEVGREKQLFVDDVLIQSTAGLKRTLNPLSKHPRNPLLKAELPWEVNCRYLVPNVVLREGPGKPFRAWYGCYIREPEGQKKKLTYVCLAESDDGLQWTRRKVDRYKIEGAPENAAVWEGRAFKPIFDPRDPDSGRRYKGMTRVDGFTPMFSPDGVRWNKASSGAVSQAFDSTSFHWDPVGQKWIASCKIFRNGKRTRGYAESRDFLHWTDTYPMLATDEKDGPEDQTYALRIFRYESVYVGLLKIYHLDTDRCDVQLVFSRNAKHWERSDRSVFLANAKQPDRYDYGNIDDAGDPIPVGDQLWFYYSGRSTLHQANPDKPDGSLCLGTLRLDGFISLNAGGEEGILVTKPLTLAGDSLYVNADAQGGEIRVEILDAESQEPILAYTKANCTPLGADSVRQAISWQDTTGVPRNQPVRLRFYLRNAKLYSFWTE